VLAAAPADDEDLHVLEASRIGRTDLRARR
jgi:hypothetical protein